MGFIVVTLAGAALPFKQTLSKQSRVRSEKENARYPTGSLIFFGCQPGKVTLDGGRFTPGNPFGTAFVEALSESSLRLSVLGEYLFNVTKIESGDSQFVDAPPVAANGDLLLRTQGGQRRVALVLIVSEYVDERHLPSLDGARKDADRISAALEGAGYQVIRHIDSDKNGIENGLRQFRLDSLDADVAIIYATGHGMETRGSTYLLMRDIELSDGPEGLRQRALTVNQIAEVASARIANLVFFAACRNNPFKW